MQVFKYELFRNKKMYLLFFITIFFVNFAAFSKFEALAQNPENTVKIIDAMPRVLQIVFGFYNLDITTVAGYSGTMYVYYILILCVFSSNIGFTTINREQSENVQEFTGTLPMKTTTFYFQKFFANMIKVVLIALVSVVAIVSSTLPHANGQSISFFNSYAIAIVLQMLMFYFFGVIVAASSRISRSSLPVLSVLMLYLYSTVIIVLDLKSLYFLSPFAMIQAWNIEQNSIPIIYLVAVTGVAFLLSYFLIRKYNREVI